jgi:hypothetical protein
LGLTEEEVQDIAADQEDIGVRVVRRLSDGSAENRHSFLMPPGMPDCDMVLTLRVLGIADD